MFLSTENKKILKRHGPCPQKPHGHISHITEWKGGGHKPSVQSRKQGAMNSAGGGNQGIFFTRFELNFEE